MIQLGNRNAFWIEIINDKIGHVDNGDGKWVVILPQDHFKKFISNNRKLLKVLDDFVNQNNLLGLLITKKYLDELVVFTTADRFDIYRVKNLLIKELSINETKMIWKPDFETDKDWHYKHGKRAIISNIIINYEKIIDLTKQKRLEKAQRVFNKDIHPKIQLLSRLLLEDDMKKRDSMIIKPAFPTINYDIDPKMIFVIMPFNEKFSNDLFYMIKQAGEEANFKIVRADDIFSPEIIINDIWKHINQASLIIADITVHNANVFYELGIAHTLGKKVVLLRKAKGKKAPFDISYWRYFEYDITKQKADEFINVLKAIFLKHREMIRGN